MKRPGQARGKDPFLARLGPQISHGGQSEQDALDRQQRETQATAVPLPTTPPPGRFRASRNATGNAANPTQPSQEPLDRETPIRINPLPKAARAQPEGHLFSLPTGLTRKRTNGIAACQGTPAAGIRERTGAARDGQASPFMSETTMIPVARMVNVSALFRDRRAMNRLCNHSTPATETHSMSVDATTQAASLVKVSLSRRSREARMASHAVSTSICRARSPGNVRQGVRCPALRTLIRLQIRSISGTTLDTLPQGRNKGGQSAQEPDQGRPDRGSAKPGPGTGLPGRPPQPNQKNPFKAQGLTGMYIEEHPFRALMKSRFRREADTSIQAAQIITTMPCFMSPRTPEKRQKE